MGNTHQRRVEGGAVDADAGVRVLFRGRVRRSVRGESRVRGESESGGVVLARAHALARHGVRDQGPAALAARGRDPAPGAAPRPRAAAGGDASGAHARTAASGTQRGRRRCRGLPRHQQLQTHE